jgi:hypothetical protein
MFSLHFGSREYLLVLAYIYLANSGRPRLFPWQQGGIAPAKAGGIRVLSDNSSRQAVGGCISAPRALPYILIAANPPETQALFARNYCRARDPFSVLIFHLLRVYLFISPQRQPAVIIISSALCQRKRKYMCARVCICSIDRGAPPFIRLSCCLLN